MAKAKSKDETEMDIVEKVPSPVYKAFSIERVKGGWVHVTITFQDGQITEIVYSEPDLKVIIIEKFKIEAFKYWSSIG